MIIIFLLRKKVNASELKSTKLINLLPTTERSPGDQLLNIWINAQNQTAPSAQLMNLLLILVMLIPFAGTFQQTYHLLDSSTIAAPPLFPPLLSIIIVATTAASAPTQITPAAAAQFSHRNIMESIATEVLLLIRPFNMKKVLVSVNNQKPIMLPTTQKPPGDHVFIFWLFANIQTAPLAI